MTPAYPSRALYATATTAERQAGVLCHTEPGFAGKRCAGSCMACLLDAKARLFGRAGDAAAAVADGGPASPAFAAPAAGENDHA